MGINGWLFGTLIYTFTAHLLYVCWLLQGKLISAPKVNKFITRLFYVKKNLKSSRKMTHLATAGRIPQSCHQSEASRFGIIV